MENKFVTFVLLHVLVVPRELFRHVQAVLMENFCQVETVILTVQQIVSYVPQPLPALNVLKGIPAHQETVSHVCQPANNVPAILLQLAYSAEMDSIYQVRAV